jgi:hypothetical protein
MVSLFTRGHFAVCSNNAVSRRNTDSRLRGKVKSLPQSCQVTDGPHQVGVFALVKSFYNLYLHPLRSYPGPWLARASRWYYSYYLKRGILPQKTKQWHDRYGPCVRIAPDELSYNTAEAWEDICGREMYRLLWNLGLMRDQGIGPGSEQKALRKI